MELAPIRWPEPDTHGLASWPVQAQPHPDPTLALVREADDERRGPMPAGRRRAPAADSDEFLMHAFAGGDAAAFTRLYDRHERATWRFIRHRLGAQHEGAADDVLQETWISVARAAPRYVATARFTTWLFTVARSRVIDHLRAQANAMLSIDAPAGRLGRRPTTTASAGPTASRPTRPTARSRASSRASRPRPSSTRWRSCPTPQREAFVLQAEGGLSVDEVASATGVGAETAKTRLRYAKARLRTLLAGWRAS